MKKAKAKAKARTVTLRRFAIVPNFNNLTAETHEGEVLSDQLMDLSDLNLEGVHAAQVDLVKGTVEVEYIRPANETMTIKEFHDYFSKATGSGRKHLDEAHKAGREMFLRKWEKDAERAAADAEAEAG